MHAVNGERFGRSSPNIGCTKSVRKTLIGPSLKTWRMQSMVRRFGGHSSKAGSAQLMEEDLSDPHQRLGARNQWRILVQMMNFARWAFYSPANGETMNCTWSANCDASREVV